MVKKVLSRLMEDQLAVSIKKSEFQVKTVEFQGYIVATDGVTIVRHTGRLSLPLVNKDL